MGQACCCKMVVEATVHPFQERVFLLRLIAELLGKQNYEEAKNVISQLCKDLEVSRETKLVSNLGLVDLLQQNEFLVDRQAHDIVRRLQEALPDQNNRRRAMSICTQLSVHFDFHLNSEAAEKMTHIHRKYFHSKYLHDLKIIGWKMNREPTFKALKAMISRNPNLQKIVLTFVGLTDEKGEELLRQLIKGKHNIYYLGLKGNDLTYVFINVLQEILEDPNNFPLLCWVELRNNNKINWLPSQLMTQLRTRWERAFQHSDFCTHDREETKIMAAIDAVVKLNDKVRKHTLEEQKDNVEEQ